MIAWQLLTSLKKKHGSDALVNCREFSRAKEILLTLEGGGEEAKKVASNLSKEERADILVIETDYEADNEADEDVGVIGRKPPKFRVSNQQQLVLFGPFGLAGVT